MHSLVTTGRPSCGTVSGKGLSQGHNDTLPSSGNEPRVDNLAVFLFCCSTDTKGSQCPYKTISWTWESVKIKTSRQHLSVAFTGKTTKLKISLARRA